MHVASSEAEESKSTSSRGTCKVLLKMKRRGERDSFQKRFFFFQQMGATWLSSVDAII